MTDRGYVLCQMNLIFVSSFPSINGYFSDERRSPRVSVLDVQAYASGENPCACPLKCEAYLTGSALFIEKTSHL